MFVLNEFYNAAHSGNRIDDHEVIEFIKSFQYVVIWGASYLGAAIGAYLLSRNVTIEKYWDIRASDIISLNQISVDEPFSMKEKKNTLVIFCIGNNVIRDGLLKQLAVNGYMHILRGDYLYMGVICPFDKSTGIDPQHCQMTMCCRSVFCQRLSNIIQSKCPSQNNLHMFSITLIVNSRCSLGCKYCTSYMNAYPRGKRQDIPLSRINADVDKFFAVMDSVGTITVMGGEPFMHKDISKIVTNLLSKENFGLISIATSGTYLIKSEQLEGLNDKRVNISFSNYESSLNDIHKKILHKNITMVENSGISHTLGVVMPEWSIPSTLFDQGYDVETMIGKKKRCVQPPRCMQIKNGKLHPCDFGTALYSLGVADYSMDYVDIEHSQSKEDLRNKIKKFITQPYYHSCGHCIGMLGLTKKAGEQGFLDFMKPIDI